MAAISLSYKNNIFSKLKYVAQIISHYLRLKILIYHSIFRQVELKIVFLYAENMWFDGIISFLS